jgi:hypothetical protein
MEDSHTEFLAATCFRAMEHQWKVNPKSPSPSPRSKHLSIAGNVSVLRRSICTTSYGQRGLAWRGVTWLPSVYILFIRMKLPQLRPHGDSLSALSDLHSYGSISEHVRPPPETVTDLAVVDAIIPLVLNSAIICHLP